MPKSTASCNTDVRDHGPVYKDPSLAKTDLTRWRLKVSDGSHGRQTWHYLPDDPKILQDWPQSEEDRYWLGLATGAPELPKPKTPLDAARNGFQFYKRIQSDDGHWAGEYGGPMFILPGFIIGMYVTRTPIPQEWKIEMIRYLSNKTNSDGGWGIHTEGPSTVFGTALNYCACRILGLDKQHAMVVKARSTLQKLGGATGIPMWGKVWLAILNVYDWSGMHPMLPELWCLPDWVPIHPWRWWVLNRVVYLPMCFLWGKNFKATMDPLLASLREELYVQDYDSIDWPVQRNNIAKVDNFYPHTLLLDTMMAAVGVYDRIALPFVRKAGLRRSYQLLCQEDENTSYQTSAPVNKVLNHIARWSVEGPGSYAVRQHEEKLKDFVWMGQDGCMVNGTNGSQLWDAAFIGQALVDSGLVHDAENADSCQRLLDWLDKCQIQHNPKHHKSNYRFATKGAWPFSTPEQGYFVSDCTGEGLKSVIALQSVPAMKMRVSLARMEDAVDLLLSVQNTDGGFASYDTINGPALLEWINPAEVFEGIMIEHNYCECTTSAITALLKFRELTEYRRADIDRCVDKAVNWVLKDQRADGSWYGSWAICFTYAAMFALESLALAGSTYGDSPQVKKAVEFLLSKQQADGGWGETYKSCETEQYVQASESQVVQTAYVIIALLHAGYQKHDQDPIRRAVKLIMARQRPDGRWEQELIEGVFSKNCMIAYPNYKHTFTIRALGKAARELDW